ncbi:MAG: hypothetical protein ACRDE2_15275, partial [Chitinophagaceae bacterium]
MNLIGIHALIYITLIFSVAFLLIVAVIFLFLSYNKSQNRKKEHLKKKVYLLIEKVLFYDPLALQNEADDAWIKILSKFEPLLRKKFSRAFLRDQIIQVQKNISGTSK